MTNWNEDDLPEDAQEDELEDVEIQPGDPDYDLSEAHGYSEWEPPRDGPAIPQWALVTVTLLVIAALTVPSILLILRYT